jgi:predicted phosphodiesterase
MRIAIISDIHSNLEALTKALEIIDKISVNEIICLGDIIGYGANPNECVELVHQHCKIVIKGNHEDAINNLELVEHFTDNARKAIAWTRNQLTKENVNYLQGLPLSIKKENLMFVHATPCDPKSWDYILDKNTAVRSFQCFSESLCFIGHTHTPEIFSAYGRTAAISKEERYLINIGSIGQPRDRNPNLSFGLLDTELWKYENIRAPYDVETAVLKILRADLPPRLGHRLLTGL